MRDHGTGYEAAERSGTSKASRRAFGSCSSDKRRTHRLLFGAWPRYRNTPGGWVRSTAFLIQSSMTIELLYLDGCPNVQPTIDRLTEVLQAHGLDWPIIEVNIADDRRATELRFLGSPTVRIDGVDIEPTARARAGFGLMCRTYVGSGGVPSETLIRRAIAETETLRPLR